MTDRGAYVWYAAYGSNMDLERLGRYLRRCREPAAPLESRAVVLPGGVYFATESPVWGGGRAFYDPAADGSVFARAHLITVGQFSDILVQEMYREPGVEPDLDVDDVVVRGRVALGPGRYETLVCAGDVDGVPLLTFTSPWAPADVELREPSAAYVRQLAAGLRAAGGWDAPEIAGYLAACPGAAGRWSADDVLGLMR